MVSLAGCKTILASSSQDYFYKDSAYISSTSDIRKARVSAKSVCKRAFDESVYRNRDYSSDLFFYPREYRIENNEIIFKCDGLSIYQLNALELKLKEQSKNGNEKSKQELEVYKEMYPTPSESSVSCITSGTSSAFSVSCF